MVCKPESQDGLYDGLRSSYQRAEMVCMKVSYIKLPES